MRQALGKRETSYLPPPDKIVSREKQKKPSRAKKISCREKKLFPDMDSEVKKMSQFLLSIRKLGFGKIISIHLFVKVFGSNILYSIKRN